jgi:hypothetical protein
LYERHFIERPQRHYALHLTYYTLHHTHYTLRITGAVQSVLAEDAVGEAELAGALVRVAAAVAREKLVFAGGLGSIRWISLGRSLREKLRLVQY